MSESTDSLEAGVRERVQRLRARIQAACERAGRSPDEVTLVGASKGQSVARVAAAVRAGVLHLGENYVGEARDKRPELEAALAGCELRERVVWRMIGGLQRNKARAAVSLFDRIDSLDRAALAIELDRRAGAVGRVLEVCLQVNLSREPQKSGISREALPELLQCCVELPNLRVTGLMTVPAASADPEASRPTFALLRELRDTLQGSHGVGTLRELSMGMSGDFEIAVEEGSTLVRIGTMLFGPRPA